MRAVLTGLRIEFKPMLALAGPVVMAEIGWMTMGIVDIMMVGRLGAEAIGAVSIGHVVFLAVAIFGVGLLLGLDTEVSRAFGGRRMEECHRWLFQGVCLSLALSLPLTALLVILLFSLGAFGINPKVLALTPPYLEALIWSLPALLLYTAFRRYLQALNLARPVMFALLSANLVNVAGNWILIFGNLGAPVMGVRGAGWATCISRIYMTLFLFIAIIHYNHEQATGLFRNTAAVELRRMRRLLSLGFPAALQVTLEMGVFSLATLLVGQLDPASIAAHQIALSAASFTFMVPLGVASAGAVRVGQALGRQDSVGAARSGWTALFLGASFMVGAGLVFLLFPRTIVEIFTHDASVMVTGVSLLFVAAIFQLFDGLQVVATGILRGTGDTRTPMLCNLVGHWLLGLPIGYSLCFKTGWGVYGLWIGLSTGLIAVGIVLVYFWNRRVRSLPNASSEATFNEDIIAR